MCVPKKTCTLMSFNDDFKELWGKDQSVVPESMTAKTLLTTLLPLRSKLSLKESMMMMPNTYNPEDN